MAVVGVMEGEAYEWVAGLYRDHAGDLGDIGLFLSSLQERFKNNTSIQQEEGDQLVARRHGRPVVVYIQEFRQLAEKVRGWPEKLLVHQFKAGLDHALRQTCVTRGLPPRLAAWIQAATEIHIEFRRED